MARVARRSGVELLVHTAHAGWAHPLSARVRGAMIAAMGLALIAAFATYHPTDPSFNAASPEAPRNLMGGVGATAADLGLQSLGLGAWLIAAMMVISGVCASPSAIPPSFRWRTRWRVLLGVVGVLCLVGPFGRAGAAVQLAAGPGAGRRLGRDPAGHRRSRPGQGASAGASLIRRRAAGRRGPDRPGARHRRAAHGAGRLRLARRAPGAGPVRPVPPRPRPRAGQDPPRQGQRRSASWCSTTRPKPTSHAPFDEADGSALKVKGSPRTPPPRFRRPRDAREPEDLRIRQPGRVSACPSWPCWPSPSRAPASLTRAPCARTLLHA